jgi:hypothetical protein
MNSSRFSPTAFAIAGAILILAAPGFAANVTWINPGTGNWVDGPNWNTGAPPNSATADAALIENGGTAVIDATQNVSTGNLTLAGPAGTAGNLQMTGGSLTTTNTDIRVSGNGAATGGIATFTQSDGSVLMNAGNLNVGFGTGGNGTYNLSGNGSMLVNAGFIMAVGNVGTGTVTQSGGTLYIRSATIPANSVIQIGRNSGTVAASGTYTLSGGLAAARNFQFGRVGTAQTAGGQSTNIFNLQGTGKLITNGVSLGNTPAFMTATFNFTGGTLVANSIAMLLTNNGGILAPDFADFTGVPTTINAIPITEISTLTFTGSNSYVQNAGGTLEIDIASAASSDFVSLGAAPTDIASANISGRIAVNLLGGFDPPVGSFFDILAADTVTENALVTGLTPSGNSFDAIPAVAGDGRQLVRLVVIPEPGSAALFALAGAALCGRRRRGS